MKNHLLHLGMAALVLAVALIALYLFPPSIIYRSPRTVTVTGLANTQKTNEIAQFTAGVSAVNDDKQKAVTEVNTKVTELIKAVKAFGINSKDIKTQNMNIYQNQEMYYEGDRQKQRMGQWNVSNSVEIVLRDVQKATALSDLLSQSGANNVYGPNFSLDTAGNNDETLVREAMTDATARAKSMAKNSGFSLGRVITVQEGYAGVQSPLPFRDLKGMGGGGGAPTEVGSTTVTKAVTVTFELK